MHLLTVNGNAVADKTLLANADAGILDAGHGLALMSTALATSLAVMDLRSGAFRAIGSWPGCEFGSGRLSPDGTLAALAIHAPNLASEIVIVDLRSNESRPVLQIPPNEYNNAGLVPVQWLPSGILVTPGVWDGPHFGLLNLNPDTGALTRLADAQLDRLSADGRIVAAAQHTDLGDGPFNGQGSWPNQLTVGPVGVRPTTVASQKDRAFYPLDLENDGSLLYAEDDAPGSTATPASDAGLYLYRNGTPYQQFGEDRVSQWQSAALLGQGLALVAEETSPGETGAVEIELATLCTTAGCRAASRPVLSVAGRYPLSWLVHVRQ